MDQNTRTIRRQRIRSKVSGTAQRPRASVFRSNTRLVVQLIDDQQAKTLAAVSGPDAKKVGADFAGIVTKQGITNIVFDRGGYKYHGRIKDLADSMREAGLVF